MKQPLQRISAIAVCLVGLTPLAMTAPKNQANAPRLIGTQPNFYSSGGDINSLDASPDGRWIVSTNQEGSVVYLWDVHRSHLAGKFAGYMTAFAPDSSQLAVLSDADSKPRTLRCIGLTSAASWQREVKFHIPIDAVSDLRFAADGKILYQTAGMRTLWNAKTGKTLSFSKLARSVTDTVIGPTRFVQRDTPGQKVWTRITAFDLKSKRKLFGFDLTNEYEIWEVAADNSVLWFSCEAKGRFDFLDARTGRLLWHLTSREGDSGTFRSYPTLSGDGHWVARFEGRIVSVRNSRTGALANSLSNPLFAHLSALGLSRRAGVVFFRDERGRIWQQRLAKT